MSDTNELQQWVDLSNAFYVALHKLAQREDDLGARVHLQKIKERFDIQEIEVPACAHCGKSATILERRRGVLYCQDARSCYHEEVIPNFVDNFCVSIRQYQVNTNVAYWYRHELPLTPPQYIDGPVSIWAKIRNDEFDRETELLDLGDWLAVRARQAKEVSLIYDSDALRQSETGTVHICADGGNYRSICGYYVTLRTEVIPELNGNPLCERCKKSRLVELKKKLVNRELEPA